MRARSAERSSRPLEYRISSPNSATMAPSAGSPGSTTSRATWSRSMTGTPRLLNSRATVDLPLAMPPVRPILRGPASNGGGSSMSAEPGQLQVSAGQLRPPQESDPAGRREIRPEGNRYLPVPAEQQDHGDADDGTNHR